MTDYQFKMMVKKLVEVHSIDKVSNTIGVSKQTIQLWTQGRNLAHPVLRDSVAKAAQYIDRGVLRVPKE
jgi:hypothetical protein